MSQILNQTQAYEEQARGGIYTNIAPRPGPNGAQVTAEFQRGGLEHRDARDELMKAKAEFVKQYGATNTPLGEIHASDEDLMWLTRKRDTEAEADLDAWIGQQFNTGDVAQRAWLQRVFPDYFEARERKIVDRAKFATRVNLLLLRGPKNEKDLILLWGLQTGRIQLDRDWNVIGPRFDAQGKPIPANPVVEDTRFKEGLFNFLRYKTDPERAINSRGSADAPNPFRPNSNANAQQPNPFLGPVSNNRYPNFLAKLGL